MSWFTRTHEYAFTDRDLRILDTLELWNGRVPLPAISLSEIQHVIRELYNAMDTLNAQRHATHDTQLETHLAAVWQIYHVAYTRALDLQDRLLRGVLAA